MVPYSVLSQKELEQVVEQAFKILNTVGVEVEHPAAQEKMTAAGAKVEKNRICIPSSLVEKCLSELPRELLLAGRSPEFDVKVKQGDLPRVRAQSGCIRFLDSRMKTHRPLDTKDCMNIAKLEEDIRLRDASDIEREHSPLVKAEDAVEIDTTPLDLLGVVEKILSFIL